MKAFEKPLSAKEEKEMIERFHNGDMEARYIGGAQYEARGTHGQKISSGRP